MPVSRALAAALLLLAPAAQADTLVTFTADIFAATGDYAPGELFDSPVGGTMQGFFLLEDALPSLVTDPDFGTTSASIDYARASAGTVFDGLGAALYTVAHDETSAYWEDDVVFDASAIAALGFTGRLPEGTYDVLQLWHGVFNVSHTGPEPGGEPFVPAASDLVMSLLIVAGSDWFGTLPPDRQKLVRDTMTGMTGFIDEVVVRFNKEKLEKIKQAKPGINLVVLTEDERAAFRERSAATHSAYTDIVGDRGQQLLDALLSEVYEAPCSN